MKHLGNPLPSVFILQTHSIGRHIQNITAMYFSENLKKKKKKRYKPDKITYMFFSLFKFLDVQITVTFCKRGFSWTKNHSTVGSVDVWYLSEML